MMTKTVIAEKIKALTSSYTDEEVSLLRAMCTVDCGTGNRDGNQKILDILSDFYSKIEIPFELVDAGELGKHFLARIVPENPKGKIILNAHLDTIFKIGDVEKNPFLLDEDGWLHGCGVSDCKGGVVISSFALRICKELGLLPNYEIVVIYNCDEELGSPSGRELFAREAKNASYAYVFEPARDDDGILTMRMGHATCQVTVYGKQAHPAQYKLGASATECLIKMLNRLYEKNAEMENIYFNVADFISGPSGIMSPRASANISFRINDENPYEKTKAILHEIFSDIPVSGCSTEIVMNLHFPQMKRCDGNIRMYEHMKKIGKNFWTGTCRNSLPVVLEMHVSFPN